MSEVRRKDAERKLLTLAILDGTIDRPTAADLVRCIDKLECRIDALEQRIEAVEWLTDIVKAHSKLFDAILRKLNHKSIETSGVSIKIANESIEIGDGE